MNIFLPLTILFFFPCLLWAQKGTNIGHIIDEDGTTMIGVSVIVNGSLTEIPDVASHLPPLGSQGFRNIIADASDPEGEKIFIPLRNFGTSSSGSSSWIIDDMSIFVE